MIKKRAYSNLVDILIYILMFLIISNLYINNNTWFMFVIFILFICFYYTTYDIIFNKFNSGRTIGKMIFGISVIDKNQKELKFIQILKRNIPIFLIGFVTLLVFIIASIIDFGVYNYSFSKNTSDIHENIIPPILLNSLILVTLISPIIWLIVDIFTAKFSSNKKSILDSRSGTVIKKS